MRLKKDKDKAPTKKPFELHVRVYFRIFFIRNTGDTITKALAGEKTNNNKI